MSTTLLFAFRPVTGSPAGTTVDPFWRDKTRCVVDDVPQLVKLPATTVTPAQAAVPYRPYSKECADTPPPATPPANVHCCSYTTTVAVVNVPLPAPTWNALSRQWETTTPMIRVTTQFDCPEGFTVPDIVQTFAPETWAGYQLGVVDQGTRCFA